MEPLVNLVKLYKLDKVYIHLLFVCFRWVFGAPPQYMSNSAQDTLENKSHKKHVCLNVNC